MSSLYVYQCVTFFNNFCVSDKTELIEWLPCDTGVCVYVCVCVCVSEVCMHIC